MVKVSKIPLKVVMSLPYYTLSSLGISNNPPEDPLRGILGTLRSHIISVRPVFQLTNNTELTVFVVDMRKEKHFNKAATLSVSLFFFPSQQK